MNRSEQDLVSEELFDLSSPLNLALVDLVWFGESCEKCLWKKTGFISGNIQYIQYTASIFLRSSCRFCSRGGDGVTPGPLNMWCITTNHSSCCWPWCFHTQIHWSSSARHTAILSLIHQTYPPSFLPDGWFLLVQLFVQLLFEYEYHC